MPVNTFRALIIFSLTLPIHSCSSNVQNSSARSTGASGGSGEPEELVAGDRQISSDTVGGDSIINIGRGLPGSDEATEELQEKARQLGNEPLPTNTDTSGTN